METKMIGEIPVYRISAGNAELEFSTYGAHILSYKVNGVDLLWVSEKAVFSPGKAIRGGIPVCWPWFGSAGTPTHGVARIAFWDLAGEPVREADGSVSVKMTLTAAEQGLAAVMEINLGATLKVSLTTTNISSETVKLTEALHTYFAIGDIRKTVVRGFEDTEYFCSLSSRTEKQSGVIAFEAETDRIYNAGSRIAVIEDLVIDRKIRVVRSGSASAVVWNPWIDKAARMADYGDDEYPEMLCIEAANAGSDLRTLPPGASHTLGTEISLL